MRARPSWLSNLPAAMDAGSPSGALLGSDKRDRRGARGASRLRLRQDEQVTKSVSKISLGLGWMSKIRKKTHVLKPGVS
jgi:hypothetical protein